MVPVLEGGISSTVGDVLDTLPGLVFLFLFTKSRLVIID